MKDLGSFLDEKKKEVFKVQMTDDVEYFQIQTQKRHHNSGLYRPHPCQAGNQLKMRECLSIHIGQAGVQTGNVYETRNQIFKTLTKS